MSRAKPKRSTPKQSRHLPAPAREGLAVFEALRRLGFGADDIYMAWHPNAVAIEVHAQERQFVITCGAPGMGPVQFEKVWRRAAALWNGTEPGMTTAAREAIYASSQVLAGDGREQLVLRLLAKGFKMPPLEEAMATLKNTFPSPGGQA